MISRHMEISPQNIAVRLRRYSFDFLTHFHCTKNEEILDGKLHFLYSVYTTGPFLYPLKTQHQKIKVF